MSASSTSAVPAFEDLSGVSTAAFSNPYDALIVASEDDPVSDVHLWCFAVTYQVVANASPLYGASYQQEQPAEGQDARHGLSWTEH